MDILNTLCMILAMCNGGSAIALVWGVRVPLLRKEKFFSSQRTKGFFLPRPRPSEDIKKYGGLNNPSVLNYAHLKMGRRGYLSPFPPYPPLFTPGLSSGLTSMVVDVVKK